MIQQRFWSALRAAAVAAGLLFAMPAAAQGLQDDGTIEVPKLSSDLFRPSVDGERTLWTDDAGLPEAKTFYLRTSLYWVNRPFVWEWNSGKVETVVANATALNISAAYGLPHARLGLTLPIYAWSWGDLQTLGGAAIGDATIDAKVIALERGADGLPGIGFTGRFGVPLGGAAKQLGNDGISGEVGVVADSELGPLLLAVNLGTRFLPEVDLGDVQLKNEIWYKLGAGYAIREDQGMALELVGSTSYRAFAQPIASPNELMLGYWQHLNDNLMLQAGVSHGLSTAIGSPAWRAVLALSVVKPTDSDPDNDGISGAKDACPDAPEDFDNFEDHDGCPEYDNDKDGLTDSEDGCPNDPEDPDHYQDHDGCPEGNAMVTIELVDPQGNPVKSPRLQLSPRVGEPVRNNRSPMSSDLGEGVWLLEAEAEGMKPLSKTFEVPGQGELVLREVMSPDVRMGTLIVRIFEASGKTLDGSWQLDGQPNEYQAVGGYGQADMKEGSHKVVVRAPNFAPASVEVNIIGGEEKELVVILNPSKVSLGTKRIDIKDKVYFEVDKAVIKPESYALLDEVAQVIVDHPELLRIRIEGHTDSDGPDAYNMRLSQDRADAVRAYLIGKNVEAGRLYSIGYGETQPVDTNGTAAGKANNRRVVFYIEQRAE